MEATPVTQPKSKSKPRSPCTYRKHLIVKEPNINHDLPTQLQLASLTLENRSLRILFH